MRKITCADIIHHEMASCGLLLYKISTIISPEHMENIMAAKVVSIANNFDDISMRHPEKSVPRNNAELVTTNKNIPKSLWIMKIEFEDGGPPIASKNVREEIETLEAVLKPHVR